MDTERLLKLLKDHQVDFVVIGATAFPVHGYARATLDIDREIWRRFCLLRFPPRFDSDETRGGADERSGRLKIPAQAQEEASLTFPQ